MKTHADQISRDGPWQRSKSQSKSRKEQGRPHKAPQPPLDSAYALDTLQDFSSCEQWWKDLAGALDIWHLQVYNHKQALTSPSSEPLLDSNTDWWLTERLLLYKNGNVAVSWCVCTQHQKPTHNTVLLWWTHNKCCMYLKMKNWWLSLLTHLHLISITLGTVTQMEIWKSYSSDCKL